MGYGRALLQRDVRKEEADLQKKAKKKSLWGSIGRTLGGLGVMALTGGAVNPLTLGLLTGAATAAGGAAGAKLSNTGDLSKGKFFKSDREAIQKELGAFGTQNLMSALKSGLTAGITQKLNLMKSGETAAKGLDFEGSFLGKPRFGGEVTGYGSREVGEYFVEETPKVSIWDKITEPIEDMSIEKQLSQYRGKMTANVPSESVRDKLGLYEGYSPNQPYHPTYWKPEEGSWLRRFYDEKYGGLK